MLRGRSWHELKVASEKMQIKIFSIIDFSPFVVIVVFMVSSKSVKFLSFLTYF
jgi:hypothetical protein